MQDWLAFQWHALNCAEVKCHHQINHRTQRVEKVYVYKCANHKSQNKSQSAHCYFGRRRNKINHFSRTKSTHACSQFVSIILQLCGAAHAGQLPRALMTGKKPRTTKFSPPAPTERSVSSRRCIYEATMLLRDISHCNLVQWTCNFNNAGRSNGQFAFACVTLHTDDKPAAAVKI